MAAERITLPGDDRFEDRPGDKSHAPLGKAAELSMELEAFDTGADIFDQEQLGGDTKLTSDGVKDYLNRIATVPLLDAEQEVFLAKRIEAGMYAEQVLEGNEKYPRPVTDDELELIVEQGKEAYKQFMAANIRLVVSIVKRYAWKGVPLIDLIQDGTFGLERAIGKFDYTKGYKFSTYATNWLKQNVRRFIADTARTIRLPVHVIEKFSSIERTRKELEVLLGREPTDDEIVAANERVTLDDVKLFRSPDAKDALAFETPIGDDGVTLYDIIGANEGALTVEDAAERAHLREAVFDLLEILPEREAGIIALRFGLVDGQPRTLDEIGKIYGFTRERARQIVSKSLRELRNSEWSDAARGFLD